MNIWGHLYWERAKRMDSLHTTVIGSSQLISNKSMRQLASAFWYITYLAFLSTERSLLTESMRWTVRLMVNTTFFSILWCPSRLHYPQHSDWWIIGANDHNLADVSDASNQLLRALSWHPCCDGTTISTKSINFFTIPAPFMTPAFREYDGPLHVLLHHCSDLQKLREYLGSGLWQLSFQRPSAHPTRGFSSLEWNKKHHAVYYGYAKHKSMRTTWSLTSSDALLSVTLNTTNSFLKIDLKNALYYNTIITAYEICLCHNNALIIVINSRL